MNILKVLLLFGAVTVVLNACSAIPYQSPEDLARMKADLGLDAMPRGAMPVRWSWFNYGVLKDGVITEESVAIVQPGSLVLVGYESGHYVRRADIPSSTVDCVYVFRGVISSEPIWLMQPNRVAFLGMGDPRMPTDQTARKELIDKLAAAGFRIHSEADGKPFRPSADSPAPTPLAQVPGYEWRPQLSDHYEVFDVCRG